MKKGWFSDDSHIHLNAYTYRQTSRFFGFQHPDVNAEKPLHNERDTVWRVLFGYGIICHYLDENENQHPDTVIQEWYRENIIKPFVRDLRTICRARNLPVLRHRLEQDGATSHDSIRSIALKQNHFSWNRLRYYFHSPDLTPPDACVWGMLKEFIFHSE